MDEEVWIRRRFLAKLQETALAHQESHAPFLFFMSLQGGG